MAKHFVPPQSNDPKVWFAHYRDMLKQHDPCKLSYNTYLTWDSDPPKKDGFIIVRYHQTAILTFQPNGDLEVDTGGWKTVSTRDRINAFSPIHLWVTKGQWYIARYASWKARLERNPPIFLFNSDNAYFPHDRRKNPWVFYRDGLIRLSVHERATRLAKERLKKSRQKDAAVRRRVRRCARYISRHRGWLPGLFPTEWEEMKQAAYYDRCALANMIQALEAQVADLQSRLALPESTGQQRERVIELWPEIS